MSTHSYMTPTGSEAHCYVTLRGRILCVTPMTRNDSTILVTRLAQVMTRLWLDSAKFQMTLTRRARDSDSTEMTRAHHWFRPVCSLLSYLTFFSEKTTFLIQCKCAHSWAWKIQLSLSGKCSMVNEGLLVGFKPSHLSFTAPPNFHCAWLFASVNR